MSSSYTPTTDEVCQAYSEETGFDIDDRVADFERWLAAHNAVVERPILRELADAERELAKRAETLEAVRKFCDALRFIGTLENGLITASETADSLARVLDLDIPDERK